MGLEDVPEFEGLPRSRRVNMPYKGGRIGFSVPIDMSDADAVSEIERALHAMADGKTREIVNIDGNHTLAERLKVAWVYVRAWSIRAWKMTLGRSAVAREKAEISATLRRPNPHITPER